MTATPDTDTHAGLTPQQPQPSVRLCGSYPSLPGNLDLTSGLSEIQKHVSDPVLPVIWPLSVIFPRDFQRIKTHRCSSTDKVKESKEQLSSQVLAAGCVLKSIFWGFTSYFLKHICWFYTLCTIENVYFPSRPRIPSVSHPVYPWMTHSRLISIELLSANKSLTVRFF